MLDPDTPPAPAREPLAVVGVGCRFPGGATSPTEFWKILADGIDCIEDVPADRWNADVFHDPDPAKAGRIKSRQGGFIKGIYDFDAGFFGYYAEEAAQLDPQQRMVLEVACQALEDAGEPFEAVSGRKVSVFVSGFLYDHLCMLAESSERDSINTYAAMGIGVCSLANRLSYCLNLKGPSVAVDTACSGSLVALHLACQSIWNGEAEAALAGGVNALLRPESSIIMSRAGFLSPDARCKAFDARANGYVRSEGCGIVYLKPLTAALRDNDAIYGVIRGTAVNQDGYTPAGFTVPDRAAQVAMLAQAYANAGVDPARVAYVEAHGPGTLIGDPIETSALGEVIGSGKPIERPFWIGSVKTNIGHLEGAAGIAGFIKAALALKHRTVPRNLHWDCPNPAIDFAGLRLRVPTESVPLEAVDIGQPVVGVNSFGAGGTNAHVVVEGVDPSILAAESNQAIAPASVPEAVAAGQHLFALSARSREALVELAQRYLPYLQTTSDSLQSISLAQLTRRSRHPHQLLVTASTKGELQAALEAFLAGRAAANVRYLHQKRLPAAKTAFVYSGQGGQWPEMGRRLIEGSVLFRRYLEEFDRAFRAVSGFSLFEEILRPAEHSRINETIIVQPAIVAIQISLTRLLRAHGVEADGIVGHSIGEVPAIWAAGAITLEQAAAIIYHRARIQDQASGKGRMLAAGLSPDAAQVLLAPYRDTVAVATVNGPEMITLSGNAEPLAAIAKVLEARGAFCRFVNVQVPYHSHHMEPLKEELTEVLGSFALGPTMRPLYSTVTTQQLDSDAIDGHYWFLNVRRPVLFTQTIENMMAEGFNTFLELGPNPVLVRGISDVAKAPGIDVVVAGAMRRSAADDTHGYFEAIAAWLAAGAQPAWAPRRSVPVALPSYPWQRRTYRSEGREALARRTTSQLFPFLKRSQGFVTSEAIRMWELGLSVDSSPYLADHTVDGTIVFPAAAHMMMALAAARDFHGHGEVFLSDLRFQSALVVPAGKNTSLDVRLELLGNEGRYTICTRDAQADDTTPWRKHSLGKINALRDDFGSRAPSLAQLKSRFAATSAVDVAAFYATIREAGLNYGKSFRCIKEMWCDGEGTLARLELHDSLEHEARRYLVHPSLYDAHLQLAFAIQQQVGDPERVYLPDGIDRAKVHRPATREVWAYVKNVALDECWLRSDHWLFDNQGQLVSELHGMAAKCIPSAYSRRDLAHDGTCEYRWRRAERGEQIPWTTLAEGNLRHCLVVADGGDPLAGQLHDALCAARPEVAVRRAAPEALAAAIAQVPLDARTHVVYVAPRAGDDPIAAGGAAVGFLRLAQVLTARQGFANLFVLTRQTARIEQAAAAPKLGHAALVGMARVLRNEYPNFPIKVIDFDVNVSAGDITAELLGNRGDLFEGEVALRAGGRFVRVLELVDDGASMAARAEPLPASGGRYVATVSETGVLGKVEFRRTPARELGPNEVELQVVAAALNYKDLMNAMGLLSSEAVKGGLAANRLGLEAAGVVTAVGAAVKEISVGDKVMARVADGFAGRCVATDDCVVRVPRGYSFDEAAAVPVAYLTAYYGLRELARLERGERVLIHSATGGVGLAAIALARAAGTEIIATAGSLKKRQWLRKEFGIEHVFDSRSNGFYDQVMQATGGAGVDVVLNSLSGKLITQGLKCLAPYGRFVELGKTDLYGGGFIDLERLAENISLYVVDVDRLAAQKPALHRRLLREVLETIEREQLPPLPVTVFPVQEFDRALKRFSRATHIGKLVLHMAPDAVVSALPSAAYVVPAHGAVVISGGASGFGLTLAQWLVGKGAKAVVLVSRGGCKSAADQAAVDGMRQAGAEVRLEQADVGDYHAVRAVLERVRESFGTVAGVVHAAGVLADATVPNMSEQRFDAVFAPKAIGAWNWHRACEELGQHPELFLLLSSISSVLGLKGQINYAAANCFEDALADYRQAHGLPAVSVNLGVLGEYAGMSRKEHDKTGVLELLDTHGMPAMRRGDILAMIEASLLEGPAQRLTASLRWQDFARAYPNIVRDVRFAEVLEQTQRRRSEGGQGRRRGLQDEIASLPADQRQGALSARLGDAIAELAGIPRELIKADQSCNRLSLDSIMLAQISTWILRNTEINYPLIKLVNGPTLDQISAELVPQLIREDQARESNAPTDPQAGPDNGTLLLAMGAQQLSPWLIRGRSTGKERRRLLCFHSMGTGASLFTHFLLNPPADTDIVAVQLPGRENRADEPFLQNVEDIVDQLDAQLSPLADRPYVIWGHSFGGIIVFELVRRWREQGRKLPAHLHLTGTIAPDKVALWQSREVLRRVTVEENRAEYLMSLARYVEDPEFIERILPVMRRDMPILQTYRYREQLQLPLDITCWAARQDDMVYPDEVALWQAHGSRAFTLHQVDGDHWFLNRNKDAITAVLEAILDKAEGTVCPEPAFTRIRPANPR
jgi:acyl transferase domain-containing protein/surfactin synthase thioesterase subunit/NAD(P)-dependent dehydrogenase (short-subunit alcohol dehydrogenase family)